MTTAYDTDEDYSSDEGLEDLDESAIQVPRIKIDGVNQQFVVSGSNARYDELNVVIFGLVKQRAFWPGDFDDREANPMPKCKSTDGKTGFPNIDPKSERQRFPWEESVFNGMRLPVDSVGNKALPCAQCNFAKWGDDHKPPPCGEIYILPIQYEVPPDEETGEDGYWALAVLQLGGSGIGPTKKYLGTFQARKDPQPAFSAVTRITLEPQKRGRTVYATPLYERTTATAFEDRADYRRAWQMLSAYLRRYPRGVEAEEIEASRQALMIEASGGSIPAAIMAGTPTPAATSGPAPEVRKPVRAAGPRPPSFAKPAAPAEEPITVDAVAEESVWAEAPASPEGTDWPAGGSVASPEPPPARPAPAGEPVTVATTPPPFAAGRKPPARPATAPKPVATGPVGSGIPAPASDIDDDLPF